MLKTFDHLPHEATGTFRWWIAAAVAFAILMTYLVASPKSSVASWKRLAMPLASLAPVRRVTIEEVEPGNTSALAGRLIEVSANVRGLRDQESVVCRWSDPVSEESSQLAYDRSSERFRGDLRLSQGASGIVRYTIEAGDAVAGPFEIEDEDVTDVAVQSVRYEPPAYTRRKATVTSSPAIQALDGTEIEIIATTSRPVARAELQFNCREVRGDIEPTGGTLAMTLTDGGNVLSAKRRLRKNAGTAAVELENYRIKVWDTDERSNPNPIVYPIQVIADLAPEVTIVVPTKSPVRVPISAQQIIEVHAMDADFELDRVMLELKRGLDTFDTPLLWQRSEAQSGRGNQVSEYRFRPSAHRLRVGDTIQVTAVAIDNRSLEDGSSAGPNQSRTDALEIQIVDDRSKEVPEDPVGNDGLSQPDDRPASQAESSRDEQGKGDSKSGDESGGEQGGGDQGSREQGGSGAQGSGSGEQNPQQQGEQGDNGQQGSGSVQSQGEPSESADAQDGQSGSGSNAGQPGSDPSETGSQNNG
ncbi:MAG: circumsporozoite protein- membrane associated protein, partial [Planctomycetota bacterium]